MPVDEHPVAEALAQVLHLDDLAAEARNPADLDLVEVQLVRSASAAISS